MAGKAVAPKDSKNALESELAHFLHFSKLGCACSQLSCRVCAGWAFCLLTIFLSCILQYANQDKVRFKKLARRRDFGIRFHLTF